MTVVSSPQQDQEELSRAQFYTRMAHLGWKCTRVVPDFAIDEFVQVFRDGAPVGTPFLVQLKSVPAADRIRLESGVLSTAIEAKHLKTWSVSGAPIVLVVWDVGANAGCWCWIEDELKRLDTANARWRDYNGKRTIRIHVSEANLFDERGMKRLTARLARYYEPSMRAEKGLKIAYKLSFPDTPEGYAERAAFERVFFAGDSYTIAAPYVEELRFPDWFVSLHDLPPVDPEKAVTIIGPGGAGKAFTMHADFATADGIDSIRVPNLEMRTTKSGSDEATLSNEHQATAFTFQAVFTKTGFSITPSLGPHQSDVLETLELLRLQAIIAKGGTVRLTFPELDASYSGSFPSGLIESPDDDFLILTEKLAFIQQRTGTKLRFAEQVLSNSEVRTIYHVHAMTLTGRIEVENPTTATLDLRMLREGIVQLLEIFRHVDQTRLVMTDKDHVETILGTDIHLGTRILTCMVRLNQTLEELDAMCSNLDASKAGVVKLKVLHVIEEYSRWLPMATS